MNVIKTEFEDLLILVPKVFEDSRGYVFESWRKDDFASIGITCKFILETENMSSHGVVCGLHWQVTPYTQAKLVHVISGSLLYVAVDIRKGSSTYGKHISVELSGENKRQLFIPRGFAHGFVVLSQEAVFACKSDSPNVPSAVRGMRMNDVTLGIDLQIPRDQWLLSDEDKQYPCFADIDPWDATE